MKHYARNARLRVLCAVLWCFLSAVVGTAAVTPAACAATADELRAQLANANQQHARQIRDLEQNIASVQDQIRAAEREKAIAEANLKSHQESSGLGEALLNFFAPDDSRETFLNNRISAASTRIDTLKGQLRSYQSALATKRAEVASYNQSLNLQITKADPALRAAEAAERNRIVTDLTRDIETQKAQIEATRGIFERRIAELDEAIAERRRQGLDSVADQFEKDKQQVIEAHERHQAGMDAELRNHMRTREAFFQQNREDGIGYTNSGQVRTGIRQAARARGETVTDSTAQDALVDKAAIADSVESANRIATGAPRNTRHVSIFNGISGESVHDFLLDLKEDKLTWYEFSLRFGAYSKGAARGTWDALKDLLKLVKELGDTGGEALETALRRYGIDSNRFGRENLELLEGIARKGAILFDPTNPEGDKMAADIVKLADRLATQAERAVERTAASGDDKKALEAVGYGTATVVGGEEAAFRALGLAGKVVTKGADAVGELTTARRVATGTDEAAGAATDAARVADDVPGGAVTPPAARPRPLFSRARAAAAKESNMAPGHADQFSDVARRRDEVIMLRPVNPHSTDLIRRNFATKGMNIKGKSADLGEHAGTIPVDPRFSKLGTGETPPTPETLRLYENYNKKALGKPYETPIKDADGNITGWEPHEAVPPVAKAVPATRPDGSIITGPDGNPIMVLGDPVTGQPITADYDLFAVGSKTGPGEVGPFDPDLGSISANERGTMTALNDGARDAGYAGGNVVHHGPANRFANVLEAADFPITAFTPDGNIHTIRNVTELNDFYATWRALGYKLEAMPGWNLDPNFVPTGKFAPLRGPRTAQHAGAAAFLGASKADEDLEDGEPAAESGPASSPRTDSRPTTGDGSAAGGGSAGAGGSGGTQVAIGVFGGVPLPPFMEIAFGKMPPPTEESFTSLPPEDGATGVQVNGADIALVDFFARSGFIPFSQQDIRERFAAGGIVGGPPYVQLDHQTGSFTAGSLISLSRVTGGNVEPVHVPNCAFEHLHGTIEIDHMGPFNDPNPTGCGHGKIIR